MTLSFGLNMRALSVVFERMNRATSPELARQLRAARNLLVERCLADAHARRLRARGRGQQQTRRVLEAVLRRWCVVNPHYNDRRLSS